MNAMEKNYDVVVIGAGSGGLTAAVGFSKVGKKVLLVEREHMGGECTNTGCVPSKALLHHARDYYTAKKIAGESTQSEQYRTRAFAYVRNIIDEILAEETPDVFEKIGIDVVMGEATFVAPCCITVGDERYHFNKAIIATGSSPRPLSVPGLEEKDVLTNQNIFNLEDVPERLLVIGGGPIGMEMAQAFAMLGSHVTIAERGSRFARLEDPSISPIVMNRFTELGVKIHCNANLQKVENKQALIEVKDESGNTTTERVAYDKILVAIGRVPNLPSGLEEAGIEYSEHGVMVNKNYRTKNKDVFAVGDVSQRLKFTHTADDVARQVVTHIVSKGWLKVNNKKAVPKVTYTFPEIAQVGMSYDEARAKYSEAEVMRIEVPFSANDRAKTDDQTDGLVVVTVRRLSGTILGANLVGPAAGEILSVFTLAIDRKISLWKLRSLIYAYPTYSLVIKKAGDYFFAQQIGSLKQDLKALAKKHAPKLIGLTFWIVLIYWFQSYRIENGLSYTDLLLQTVDLLQAAPYLYIIAYAIRPLIFFPATLLTALSGALYGPIWGIIYTVFGENASANLAYWVGRFFGKDLKLEDSIIGNWVEALRKRPFESVLFMRLFYVPFDLTNYGSGILKVNWLSYFFATLIGIMPGLTVFVLLGSSISIEEFKMDGLSFNAFDPKFVALSVGIFIASIVLSKVLKKWKPEPGTAEATTN